jgi:hypothetical protein
MFSSPCKCCAARDHGLLKLTHTSEGKKISAFDCSVTRREDVRSLIDEGKMNRKYMPCPERFAFHFGCQEEGVRTALKSFDDQGAGKYMNGHEFTEFSTKAIRTCEEYRTRVTFKREVVPVYYGHEDIAMWDPEEEDPQDIGA